MSLIADALKRAQEQRRPGAEAPDKAERMLSGSGPLKVKGTDGPELTRSLTIAGTALAVAIAVLAGVVILSPEMELVQSTAYADPAPGHPGTAVASPGEIPETSPPRMTGPERADPGAGGSDALPVVPDPVPMSGDVVSSEAADVGSSVTGRSDGAVGTAGSAGSDESAGPDGAASAGAAGGAPTGSFRLELATERAGTSPRNWFALGVAAQRRGEHDVAVRFYREALARTPGDAQLHNNLGTAYRALTRPDEALAAFEAAVAADPSYAPAWSNLGIMLDRAGRGQDAVDAYREALRLDPGNPGARVNMAIKYHASGLREEAMGLLRGVLRDDPALPEAHYALARVLDEEGDVAGALRHYRLFLSTGQGQFPATVEERVSERIRQLNGGDRDG